MRIEDLLPEEKEEVMELYKLYNENMCDIEDLRMIVDFIGISNITGEDLRSFLRGAYPNMALNKENWEIDKNKLIEESNECLRFVSNWNKMIKTLK